MSSALDSLASIALGELQRGDFELSEKKSPKRDTPTTSEAETEPPSSPSTGGVAETHAASPRGAVTPSKRNLDHATAPYHYYPPMQHPHYVPYGYLPPHAAYPFHAPPATHAVLGRRSASNTSLGSVAEPISNSSDTKEEGIETSKADADSSRAKARIRHDLANGVFRQSCPPGYHFYGRPPPPVRIHSYPGPYGFPPPAAYYPSAKVEAASKPCQRSNSLSSAPKIHHPRKQEVQQKKSVAKKVESVSQSVSPTVTPSRPRRSLRSAHRQVTCDSVDESPPSSPSITTQFSIDENEETLELKSSPEYKRRASTGKWSSGEDATLRNAVANKEGKNWKTIAELLPGRTDVQCLHRWYVRVMAVLSVSCYGN